MQLDLGTTHFYIINLARDTDKRSYLAAQMEELGFPYSFVPAVETSPGSTGITLSHLKILSAEDIQVPFVILEDDCRFFFERVQKRIDLPPGTDGFYLGHSAFSYLDGQAASWGSVGVGWARYRVFSEDYLRIDSMLGLHALVYLTERFRRRAVQTNWKALLHFDWYRSGDKGYPEIQQEHLVLSPHYPWCYQSEIFGGNWAPTRPSLLDSCPIGPAH